MDTEKKMGRPKRPKKQSGQFLVSFFEPDRTIVNIYCRHCSAYVFVSFPRVLRAKPDGLHCPEIQKHYTPTNLPGRRFQAKT